jgi:hypothetical protein
MSALRFLSIACAVFAAALQAGVARAEIKTQWVEYKEGNTALRGYLAYDDAITGAPRRSSRPRPRRHVRGRA